MELEIISVTFGTNKRTLNFITNNPLDYTPQQMPLTRLLHQNERVLTSLLSGNDATVNIDISERAMK